MCSKQTTTEIDDVFTCQPVCNKLISTHSSTDYWDFAGVWFISGVGRIWAEEVWSPNFNFFADFDNCKCLYDLRCKIFSYGIWVN